MKQSDLKVVAHKEALATMSEIRRRHFLREKEANHLLNEFSQKLNIGFKPLLGITTQIEEAESPAAKIFFLNNKPLLAVFNNTLVPTLHHKEIISELPKIVVNMGAVPHICNGADLMAPGVVQIEREYKTNDYVVIVDERHNRPLAIAIALTDSATAHSTDRGKIARNIHYVGDNLWTQLKKERL